MDSVQLFGPRQHVALSEMFRARPSLRLDQPRRDYLVELLRHGPEALLNNGRGTRAYVVVAGDATVPLIVNDGDVDDCYLVSARAHYVLYMIEEMAKIQPRWKSMLLQRALAAVGAVVSAADFNRSVSINNWLFTTSPNNPVREHELRALTDCLRAHFPTHALVYRGIDPRQAPGLGLFTNVGYEPLVHRPVHEWNPARVPRLPGKSRYAARQDRSLTSEGPFVLRQPKVLSDAEAEQVARLYQGLYMEKHSRFNAHFNQRYFDVTVRCGLANATLFERKDNGEVAGFCTWYEDHEAPCRVVFSLVGYDRALPIQTYPAYRAAFGHILNLAVEKDVLAFMSTGAARFKLRRGTYEWMEYEAFDVRHLPWPRRMAWRSLATLMAFAAERLDSSQI